MSEFDDLQIPPSKSPLLLPTERLKHRRNDSADSFLLPSSNNYDDMEFIPAGDWREREGDNNDNSDSSDGEDSLEDWSLEDGHIRGVPMANVRLEAKEYTTREFSANLLVLLRDELRVPGWSTLPVEIPSSLIHIHKVSGALTNAVFFVSLPPATIDIHYSPINLSERKSPLTVAAELERVSTPTPDSPPLNPSIQTQTITVEAPTLLLRVYGPSSGILVSRKTELHILHTLSTEYAIGPKILGTFGNGRVEEYFHSRAIVPKEMRDPRISRWIGRRMRELHRVELEKMEAPETTDSSGRNHSAERPTLDGRPSSLYSNSSSSSIFSFGASSWSNSSTGSTSSLMTLNSEYGTPISYSPTLLPQRGSSESRSEPKRRNRSSISKGRRGSRWMDKMGVWENITRWTREAKLVLKELDTFAALPGFSEYLSSLPPPPTPSASSDDPNTPYVSPLSHPQLTFALREALNLPLFEQQVKLYRRFVREWEKSEGKSKRVFSHNDTQYGNLLLLTPSDNGDEKTLERSLQAPHQKIIVVDFEYASANPRGFDIANHFVEWRADYHHPTLSHSLLVHDPYPTPLERKRYLSAYLGVDGGYDGTDDDKLQSSTEIEDPRVERLEREIELWQPASHAMWAVWGVVQCKEDLMFKIGRWKKACEERVKKGAQVGVEVEVEVGVEKEMGNLDLGEKRETKSDVEEVDIEEEDISADFDYLGYTMIRISLFREELEDLGVI